MLYALLRGFKSYPICGGSEYYRYKHDSVYCQNDLSCHGGGECYEYGSGHCDNFWQNAKHCRDTFDRKKLPFEEEEI
jgi:hypothetical protein